MLEEEIFGVLTSEVFEEYLQKFTEKFGNPQKVERLKISYWNPKSDKNFDPQIRITDGKPEVMIKKGDWENRDVRILLENSFDVVAEVENVLSCIGTMNFLYQAEKVPVIQQFTNYLWEDSLYEYKLGIQFNNKNKRYIYEIESLSKESNLDLRNKELGLDKYTTQTDVKFWDEWSKSVNMYLEDLSKREIEELVSRYLD